MFGLPLMAAERTLGSRARAAIDSERLREVVATAGSTLSSDRVAALRGVDTALAEADRALARLDEASALKALARAEAILAPALALPGATLFYVELQLRIGVSAAQVGALELAGAAFERAARVDPQRRLLSGEAAPSVVALAARAHERAERAPEGEVRVSANVPGARVFVDDVERGSAPLVVRARTGPHVLRVQAQGYVPYACMFDVLAGPRPEQRFVLSELHGAQALRGFAQARRAERASEIMAASQILLAAVPELAALAFGEAAAERSFAVLCSRVGCEAPVLSTDRLEAAQRALDDDNLRDARRWLAQPAAAAALQQPLAKARSASWYVWPVVAAVVIGAAVSVGVAVLSPPQRELRVTVDSSALR